MFNGFDVYYSARRHYKSENQNKPGKFYEKSYKKGGSCSNGEYKKHAYKQYVDDEYSFKIPNMKKVSIIRCIDHHKKKADNINYHNKQFGNHDTNNIDIAEIEKVDIDPYGIRYDWMSTRTKFESDIDKNIPRDWLGHHDRTRWSKDKNRSKKLTRDRKYKGNDFYSL